MQEVIHLLQHSPALYLSTIDKNGYPRVRPVVLMLEQNTRLYFCTSKKAGIYEDLQYQPYVEISVVSPEYEWTRVAGKVIFVEDKQIKRQAIENKPQLQKLFETPDNPDFQVFYLAEGSAALMDYSGQPPRVFSFSH